MVNEYVGRFAPSPTGLLHAGSLAAALASFIDAKAHNGRWLIRIEDVDQTRCKKDWAEGILEVLRRLEMPGDGEIIWQSRRTDRYAEVLDRLIAEKKVYGCSCSRHSIELLNRLSGSPLNRYPGTCRNAAQGPIRSWRFKTNSTPIKFEDRWAGPYSQNVEKEVGDFVVKRADGLFAYQLAVVIDDHDSGVNHVVRGADLIDNTPRQIAIYEALDWHQPAYMHIPLVLNEQHEKLSKQAGDRPLGDNLLDELSKAWIHLGFDPIKSQSFSDFYLKAAIQWQNRFL